MNNKLIKFLCMSASLMGSASLGMDVSMQGEELCSAVEGGNLEAVQALLAAGVSVDSKEAYGCTPLMLAACIGHYYPMQSQKLCELLIAHNADVNASDKMGRTPFHWATQLGTKGVCTLLILNKAKINERNDVRHTPLEDACTPNMWGEIRYTLLIDAVVNVIKLRATIFLGLKKFHKAACMKSNEINIIKLIVRYLCEQEKQKLYELIGTIRHSIDPDKMVLEYAKKQLSVDKY
jgi:hypothetical protein